MKSDLLHKKQLKFGQNISKFFKEIAICNENLPSGGMGESL